MMSATDTFLEVLAEELLAMSDEEILDGQDPAEIERRGAELLARAKASPSVIAATFQNALLDTQTLGELVATLNAFHADPAVADADCELWSEGGVSMGRGRWVAAVQGAIAFKAAYGEGVQ